MPMWMSWLNLQTDKTERIYNYHDPDTPEGQMAIDMATHCLWQRFQVPPDQIPGFRVENPPGLSAARMPEPVEEAPEPNALST